MVRNSRTRLAGRPMVQQRRQDRTREIDGSVVVGVDLVDHVLELRLGGVLSQTPHDGTQLLGGDLSYRSQTSSQLAASDKRGVAAGKQTIAILVLCKKSEIEAQRRGLKGKTYKEGEGLLELGNLLFGEGVGLGANVSRRTSVVQQLPVSLGELQE